jgi:hypothetical protein
MPDRQIIRKFAATATAALMSAAFWSGTALAAPETDKPLPPPEQELKPASGQSASILANPANCKGKTNYPHKSTHVPNSVNVTASTTCDYAVDRVMVDVKLYSSRWYGWALAENPPGPKNLYGVRSVSNNHADYDCAGVHDYLGESYHEGVISGEVYSTSTSRRVDGISCG